MVNKSASEFREPLTNRQVAALSDGGASDPGLQICRDAGRTVISAVIVMDNEGSVEDVELILWINAHELVPCLVVSTVA